MFNQNPNLYVIYKKWVEFDYFKSYTTKNGKDLRIFVDTDTKNFKKICKSFECSQKYSDFCAKIDTLYASNKFKNSNLSVKEKIYKDNLTIKLKYLLDFFKQYKCTFSFKIKFKGSSRDILMQSIFSLSDDFEYSTVKKIVDRNDSLDKVIAENNIIFDETIDYFVKLTNISTNYFSGLFIKYADFCGFDFKEYESDEEFKKDIHQLF